MIATERLRIEVADAIERTPTADVAEVVAMFVNVVAQATEDAYVRLVGLGLSDRMAQTVLGIPPLRPLARLD